MRLFIKTEDGVFVMATPEQVKDESIAKYTYVGDSLKEVAQEVAETLSLEEAPEGKTAAVQAEDSIKELAGVISELAGGISGIKDKQEEIEEEISKYREAAKRGFVMPGSEEAKEAGTKDELDEILKGFNMAVQGKRLQDRVLVHSRHTMSEETRQELAKFMCLFIKAGFQDDPRAQALFRERYGEAKTGTTEIGDSGNVFPVPDPLMVEILHYARESSIALQEANIVDMTSEKVSWPLEGSGVAVAWGNTTEESDPTISEVEIEAKELSAYSKVRNTQLADATSDIVSWITDLMGNAIGQELDNEMFNGTGSNSCSGILSAKCGYSVQMDSGSTAFSNLTGTHLSEMISKLDGVRKNGAKFYFNGVALHYIRSLKDDNNRPIFMETVGSSVPGAIWGFPYRECVKITGTSAANTAFVAFGNLRNFYWGRRLGSTTLSVNPYLAWTTNRTAFKIYNRWGCSMPLPNAFVRLLTAAS